MSILRRIGKRRREDAEREAALRIPRTAGQSVSRADIEQITAEHVYWYRRRNRRR